MYIGDSKVQVGPMSMRTWAMGGGQQWGDNDDAVSERTVHEAIEQDITWIDTAPRSGIQPEENGYRLF